MFGGTAGMMRAAKSGNRGAQVGQQMFERMRARRQGAPAGGPESAPKPPAGGPGGRGQGLRSMLEGMRSAGTKPASGGYGSAVREWMSSRPSPGGNPQAPGQGFLTGGQGPQGPKPFGPPAVAQVGADKLADTLPGRMGQLHTSPGAGMAGGLDARMAAISQLLDRVRSMRTEGGGAGGQGMGQPFAGLPRPGGR